MGYMKKIFKQVFKYKPINGVVTIDDIDVYSGKLFSCCVGLGKFNGGGLMQVPHAVHNEGQFAITVIKEISPAKFIVSFPKLLRGKMLNIKEVEGFKGKKVSIKSDTAVGVEVDGEYLGLTDVKFSVIKEAVSVIVP